MGEILTLLLIQMPEKNLEQSDHGTEPAKKRDQHETRRLPYLKKYKRNESSNLSTFVHRLSPFSEMGRLLVAFIREFQITVRKLPTKSEWRRLIKSGPYRANFSE